MSRKSNLENWLTFKELNHHLKAQLEKNLGDSAMLEDQFYRHLEFGTAGMRGVIGPGTNRMNIYTVRRAAEGLACYMDEVGAEAKKRGIAIAYDSRHKSSEFALEVAKTVGKHGVKVYLFDELRPTPELSFAIRYLNTFAGVVITASHNPAEYNGFKLYGEDGGQITPQAAERIIEYIDSIENELTIPVADEEELIEKSLLTYIGKEVDQAYLKELKSIQLSGDIDKQVSVVYSPLHGTGNKLVQEGLRMLGYEKVTIVKEQELPDSNFSTVESPNPEEHAAFSLAIEYGKKVGADVLLATDPDADRLGVAVKNNNGEYTVLTGNQIGALIVQYLLEQKQKNNRLPNNGVILKSIVTSEFGRVIANDFGIHTIDTLTGFKYISEKVQEYKESNEYTYLFGYEESYGYLIGDFVRDKDAVQAALLVAEIAAYYKKRDLSLYEGLQEIYRKYGFFKETLQSLTLKGKEGEEQIKSLMEHFRENPSIELTDSKIISLEDYQTSKKYFMDTGKETTITLPQSNVLKFFCENGSWFCIRPSGTEPKIKFYFGVKGSSEDESEQLLNNLDNSVMHMVNELLKIHS